MRSTAALTLALMLAAAVCAAPAGALVVRRLVAPADAARLAGPGRLNAETLTPAESRHLAELERRWRSSPDLISRGRQDRSLHGGRRAGWTQPRPMHVIRDGAEAVITPPDTLRVAFIRIDFLSDRGGATSSGDGKFDISGPDTTLPPIDRAPHNRTFFLSHFEALRRYHETQSYGRTRIRGDVWPHIENAAYHIKDMADLGPWEFSIDIYPAAVRMFHTMIAAADSQSIALGDRIPWHQYDRIVLIHAGSDLQSDVFQDSKEDIPTFTLTVEDTDAVDVAWVRNLVTPGDSLAIDRCIIAPETESQDGYYSTLNGVLAHECGHLFYGFFDVYDFESGLPVVGYWSLMDSGNQVGSRIRLNDGSEIFATGLLPPSIDPYQRQNTGDALRPVEVAYGDTMTILDSERHPDVRRVGLSSDEFLLIENRYLAPSSAVELAQDPVTHVVLGPLTPDSLEYDALLPGGGMLVWHVDESVIIKEGFTPLDTSLRANPDYGVNTNPVRLGLSLIEADGLGDLGDLGSPYFLGSPFDPFFLSNYAVLSDTTHPNLLPHTKTRPHVTLSFLDDPLPAMRLAASRAWQLPGWPISVSFPAGGPQLLTVDADGDLVPEVCWAGGDPRGPDSTSLFAVRADGTGLFGPDLPFASLDRPPLPVMAALATGESTLGVQAGPSLFAVTTRADGPDTSTAGGRVWLLDHFGQPMPGWPVTLPAIATTPPVISGMYPQAVVLVGAANGTLYCLGLDGHIVDQAAAFVAPVAGRLAVTGDASSAPLELAAADTLGNVADIGLCPLTLCAGPRLGLNWRRAVGPHGWSPDFLWIPLDGAGGGGSPVCAAGGPQLVVRGADRAWAFCLEGSPLPGWGASLGDTLVSGLAAGDIDGDGFPDVIAQTIHSRLMYLNRTGRPAPGWPRSTTREDLRAWCPPLALDVRGDGRTALVALNGSGMLAALDRAGAQSDGWPLATGAGPIGAPLATDFNRGDGSFEIVAPDHLGHLFAYSMPLPSSPTGASALASPWPQLGGDPGRTSALTAERTPPAPAPSAGPLVKGSFKVYPNPARRTPVSFAYTLTEPARVQYEIVDTSGHRVASFTIDGHLSANLDSWDPGHLPGGLYLARVSFRGAVSNHDHSELIPVGVLR